MTNDEYIAMLRRLERALTALADYCEQHPDLRHIVERLTAYTIAEAMKGDGQEDTAAERERGERGHL